MKIHFFFFFFVFVCVVWYVCWCIVHVCMWCVWRNYLCIVGVLWYMYVVWCLWYMCACCAYVYGEIVCVCGMICMYTCIYEKRWVSASVLCDMIYKCSVVCVLCVG